MPDYKLLEQIIPVLSEVSEGNEELDVRVSVALGELQSGSAKLLRLFLEDGYDWSVISGLLDEQVPAYTTSLDAGVPGESIVGVLFSRKRQRWAAIHRASDGREVGPVWGATEALARRAAGLAGLLAAEHLNLGSQDWDSPPNKPPVRPPREGAGEPGEAGDGEPEAEDELSDWKILF